jgi:hypothetical protein
MWTELHRKTYGRVGGRYPSDMTEGEWARSELLIPEAKPGGHPVAADFLTLIICPASVALGWVFVRVSGRSNCIAAERIFCSAALGSASPARRITGSSSGRFLCRLPRPRIPSLTYR